LYLLLLLWPASFANSETCEPDVGTRCVCRPRSARVERGGGAPCVAFRVCVALRTAVADQACVWPPRQETQQTLSACSYCPPWCAEEAGRRYAHCCFGRPTLQIQTRANQLWAHVLRADHTQPVLSGEAAPLVLASHMHMALRTAVSRPVRVRARSANPDGSCAHHLRSRGRRNCSTTSVRFTFIRCLLPVQSVFLASMGVCDTHFCPGDVAQGPRRKSTHGDNWAVEAVSPVARDICAYARACGREYLFLLPAKLCRKCRQILHSLLFWPACLPKSNTGQPAAARRLG